MSDDLTTRCTELVRKAIDADPYFRAAVNDDKRSALAARLGRMMAAGVVALHGDRDLVPEDYAPFLRGATKGGM